MLDLSAIAPSLMGNRVINSADYLGLGVHGNDIYLLFFFLSSNCGTRKCKKKKKKENQAN